METPMTSMLPLPTACGPQSESQSTDDYGTSSPRVALQNDASDTVKVSVAAADGSLEVWFDDVAPGTVADLADFDVSALDAVIVTVHAGSGRRSR